MGSVLVYPRSKATLEKAANHVRGLIDSDNLFFPIVPLLEALSSPSEDGNVVVNMYVQPDSEMPSEYAFFSPSDNTLHIRESVYEGACNNNGRDRFTLAHELGHILLHGVEGIEYPRSGQAIPAYRDPEWQANTFASMLLMPRSKIRGMSTEEVMRKCGVSRQAAEIALKK